MAGSTARAVTSGAAHGFQPPLPSGKSLVAPILDHHLTRALEGVEQLPVPPSTLHTQETDGSSRCSLCIN